MTESARKPLIFIVDDEPMIRSLLTEVLKEYDCMTFPSGLKALEWLEQNPGAPVELVISDFNMREGNGVEACNHIRSRIPHIKLILMSGTSVEDVGSLARENHFDAWTRKPFSVLKFKRLVEETLHGEQVAP